MAEKKKKSAGRPRKTIPAEKSAGDKNRAQARERETIERVLTVGASARVKLYHGYLSRIGRGETLRQGEIKHFRQLESELEAAAGNGGGGARGNIIISMDEAAAYVGASKKTVSINIKRGRLRQNSDGTFDKSELDKWLARFGRKGGSTAEVESIREQQEKAELRYRLARARREEILTAQLEKTLAPWDEVRSDWGERVRLVTSGLEAFADRLPALLVGRTREEIHKLLKDEARELRVRYSREGRYCPSESP